MLPPADHPFPTTPPQPTSGATVVFDCLHCPAIQGDHRGLISGLGLRSPAGGYSWAFPYVESPPKRALGAAHTAAGPPLPAGAPQGRASHRRRSLLSLHRHWPPAALPLRCPPASLRGRGAGRRARLRLPRRASRSPGRRRSAAGRGGGGGGGGGGGAVPAGPHPPAAAARAAPGSACSMRRGCRLPAGRGGRREAPPEDAAGRCGGAAPRRGALAEPRGAVSQPVPPARAPRPFAGHAGAGGHADAAGLPHRGRQLRRSGAHHLGPRPPLVSLLGRLLGERVRAAGRVGGGRIGSAARARRPLNAPNGRCGRVPWCRLSAAGGSGAGHGTARPGAGLPSEPREGHSSAVEGFGGRSSPAGSAAWKFGRESRPVRGCRARGSRCRPRGAACCPLSRAAPNATS